MNDELSRLEAEAAGKARTKLKVVGDPAEVDVVNEVDRLHYTDVGNAKRLVALHGERILHCGTWGRWLVWNGAWWTEDHDDGVGKLATGVARGLFEDLASATGDDKKALYKAALYAESDAGIRRMLARAANLVPVLPEALDADPWLFNVPNGTINLKTGQLGVHAKRAKITNHAPVVYDEDAEAPLWDKFLQRVLPDPDVRELVRRWAGYSLTGDVTEQKLVINFGSGQNGKSTATDVFAEILGTYARSAASDLLLAKKHESHPTGLADLKGARFIHSGEIESGHRLNEALVKQLTGGDKIKARKMRQDFFDFTPTHKLWMHTNHQPVIRGTDLAIWRRVLLVPWEQTITAEEKDERLKTKLLAERSGILNWAIGGCLAWQANGLNKPDLVVDATAAYRASMDSFSDFLSECTMAEKGSRAPAGALYEAYRDWAGRTGEWAEPQKRIGERLAERGYTPGKSGSTRFWGGLRLVEPGALL